MKLTSEGWAVAGGRRVVRGLAWGVVLAVMTAAVWAGAQSISTTTVQGTVYLADGLPGSGSLTVSWPSFTTASGQAVAADRLTVGIAADGFVSVNLTPNAGALPAGLYYTAVFQMSDGSTNTEYWVVPAATTATLAQVEAQVMPAAQAVQAVSKAYVDSSIAELSGSLLTASGGSLSGPLFLSADPTTPTEAATKHYVDEQVGTAVPLTGGTMSGALQAPAVNGVEAPAAGTPQTTLQAAVTAAGTTGAMEIPPTYAGTDTFSNPNGVRVTDLRTTGAQQTERSVKEFGAVCDGVTDDTTALQAALNYANAHGVALTIPQGTCKTRTLVWKGESIGGAGKQVSALMGFPGMDVLATPADSTSVLSYTRIHDLTIYVDQSADVSCSAAKGLAAAGSCAMNRPMENNSIFSPGGNGQTQTAGTGAGWSVGNCAIAMPAATGAGGNGLKVAELENLEITTTGTDPLAQYAGAHSTHTCGLYLGQWPQWSEFRNIDIRGVNTGVAIPALPGTTPAGLNADSNRWQNITIQATHAYTAAAGCNNVLDNVVALAGNSAATAEPPTGMVLDLPSGQLGWTVRNVVVIPTWTPVQPQLTVTAAGGAVTGVTAGAQTGLGWDPYGTQVPVGFSGSCTAQATASVNANGSIGAIAVTQGGAGCSATTTASINATGNWDTAAPVNLVGGQNMTFYAGNLLKGAGGYTVWNASSSGIYGTQVDGGGGNLPGGGSYPALVANHPLGTTLEVDAFPGADFGAQVQACVNAVNAQYGGDCDARNFTGTLQMGENITIANANTTVQLPCATISTANQILVTAGTRNVTLRGCSLRGSNAATGTQGGTVFLYTGAGSMVQVGDATYGQDTMGFHMDNVAINTTGATSATAEGLTAYRTQELDLESLYFLGNANETGMTLDGTGNYTGGTIYDNAFNGFQTAVNAIGHQVANPATTDWMNASTFVRLHIDCPTSGGSPMSGTYGINLQQGDGNTFTGGDVEGCWTALHLGANAQNNTIVGLRNENSKNQVVADAGSAYNNWMTGGTMFTGALTDNGTRNSFMDSFHRTFNGMNGDYYGSQQDATLTNHFRLGTGTGNERGLLNEFQTDSGYRWTTGLSDATAGEQFYQILDQLNNVYRLSIGQYNNGQGSTNNQTVINSAGTGAVVLNGSTNAGTGGVQFGSGGATENTVASISNAGNAQFNGTLQVGGTTTFSATPTMKNQADAEIDAALWAGLTTSQKESLIYRDWNGNSQWYAEKDASNNWELNSAVGGLDSFKAYQSTNSGDTYIDASNSSGAVRINYETGAGAAFDIYGGSSSALYASFTGTTTIKFPGLAAGSGHNCLQIDNSGYLTNTGSACSTGVGTVNSGSSGQIAYYTATGTALGGLSSVPLTAGGTGATTASGALASLGAQPALGYTPLKPSNNLSDVAVPATALANLGGASTTALTSETTRAEAAETAAQATANTASTNASNALGGSANDSTARASVTAETTRAEAAETAAQATANTASTNATSALTGAANDSTARSAAAAAQSTASAALPASGISSSSAGGGSLTVPGGVAASVTNGTPSAAGPAYYTQGTTDAAQAINAAAAASVNGRVDATPFSGAVGAITGYSGNGTSVTLTLSTVPSSWTTNTYLYLYSAVSPLNIFNTSTTQISSISGSTVKLPLTGISGSGSVTGYVADAYVITHTLAIPRSTQLSVGPNFHLICNMTGAPCVTLGDGASLIAPGRNSIVASISEGPLFNGTPASSAIGSSKLTITGWSISGSTLSVTTTGYSGGSLPSGLVGQSVTLWGLSEKWLNGFQGNVVSVSGDNFTVAINTSRTGSNTETGYAWETPYPLVSAASGTGSQTSFALDGVTLLGMPSNTNPIGHLLDVQGVYIPTYFRNVTLFYGMGGGLRIHPGTVQMDATDIVFDNLQANDGSNMDHPGCVVDIDAMDQTTAGAGVANITFIGGAVQYPRYTPALCVNGNNLGGTRAIHFKGATDWETGSSNTIQTGNNYKDVNLVQITDASDVSFDTQTWEGSMLTSATGPTAVDEISSTGSGNGNVTNIHIHNLEWPSASGAWPQNPAGILDNIKGTTVPASAVLSGFDNLIADYDAVYTGANFVDYLAWTPSSAPVAPSLGSEYLPAGSTRENWYDGTQWQTPAFLTDVAQSSAPSSGDLLAGAGQFTGTQTNGIPSPWSQSGCTSTLTCTYSVGTATYPANSGSTNTQEVDVTANTSTGAAQAGIDKTVNVTAGVTYDISFFLSTQGSGLTGTYVAVITNVAENTVYCGSFTGIGSLPTSWGTSPIVVQCKASATVSGAVLRLYALPAPSSTGAFYMNDPTVYALQGFSTASAPVCSVGAGTTATAACGATGTGSVVEANSPALTGIPTAPTPATGDSSTTIATTAYVKAQGYQNGLIDCTSPSNFCFAEDFVSSSTSSGQVGQNGWVTTALNSASGDGVGWANGSYPHLGVVTLKSGTTASAGLMLAMNNGSSGPLGSIFGYAPWTLTVSFQLAQTTNERVYLGLMAGGTTTVRPASGCWLRYDTNSSFGDTAFVFECGNSGTYGTAASGISADTGWHKLTVSVTTANQVTFQVDSGTPQTLTSSGCSCVSTGTMAPAMINALDVTGGSSQSISVDYYIFKATGLSR